MLYPASLRGIWVVERRGRDLNPRRTQRPETVFETSCIWLNHAPSGEVRDTMRDSRANSRLSSVRAPRNPSLPFSDGVGRRPVYADVDGDTGRAGGTSKRQRRTNSWLAHTGSERLFAFVCGVKRSPVPDDVITGGERDDEVNGSRALAPLSPHSIRTLSCAQSRESNVASIDESVDLRQRRLT